MNGQNEKLSIKRQALLDRLLKGKIPVDLQAKTIPQRQVFSPVPLSFAQKRLWVLDRLTPGNPFYNSPEVAPIKGAIDLAVCERSINEMIRRHESLRTIFKMENDEPVQVILPELHIKVDVIDLSYLPASERTKETQRFTAEESIKPFDLERGPLLRVFVLVHAGDAHILFYNIHHIITDGWSNKLFNKEWEIIYRAFLAGAPCPLPEPAIQYADFALWQRGWLQEEKLQKQLLYWQNILGGEIPVLELPTDRPRPAISSYRGRRQFLEIAGNLAVGLAQLSLKEGCTMFMTMLAAFSVLLYRYSGQDGIMIGTPLASRTKPELEEIIGFFSNTLVLRTDMSGNPTFNQLLRRVRGITAGAYDNQDLPFEKLVEELQPDRYMNHNPLFQAMVVLENATDQTAGLEPKKIAGSDLTDYSGTAKFDLWLLIIQSEKCMRCILEYSTDLFDSATIMRLLHHFKNILAAVADDPEQPIDDIQYLAEEEKEQLLFHWNDTAKVYHIQPLHNMFEAQVEKTPDRIAVIGSTGSTVETLRATSLPIIPTHLQITYRQLNEHSNRLAGLLKEKGVEPDTIVAIKLERSIEMVIGLMGILEAGGAYLPIDPELPQDRIDYMLKDSGATLLVTANDIEGETVLCRDVARNVSTKFLPSDLLNSSNLAYIIYTSGSTGKPKGVMVRHDGVSNRLQWMQEAYHLTPEDRVLQKTPYSFDVSVWEFFWTLSYGAVLIMAKPGGHKDSAYLVEVINREQITTIHFVPTMLNVFLEDPGVRTIRSLKRVICSGEALPLEYQQRFFEIFDPGVTLHNLYGPTEASVDVTYWECERGTLRHHVPIGRPVSNTQIYILDKNLKPVPIGVHGELHIGGVQLARGYINRPELTAEKFGPQITLMTQINEIIKTKINKSFGKSRNPFSKGFLAAGGILYKTGDLARWLPDGTIEYIGRLDSQVKVRGFRIELGEIEANLREFESVSDAVVMVAMGTEDSSEVKTKKLIAYIVPDMNYWKSYRQPDALNGDLSLDQVAAWQNVFDDAYTKDPGQEDPTFNIAGWNSSYTGGPIPAGEMRTWVDNTVERILSFKPQRVMEIGCGTGLFLFRIIPHCQTFIGTDMAQEGLNYIENLLTKIKEPGWADVRTLQRRADNFADIEAGELDLIFLNSVVQYFPTAGYLVDVLTQAVHKIKPGGHIIIGDVRSLPLLKLFHTSVELAKAEPGTAKETIRRRVLNKMALEQELLIDPLFFDVLKKRIPRITHVERLIKYGRYDNELSKFRYDVILYIGEEGKDQPLIQPQLILDWKQEKPGMAGIKDLLSGLVKEGHEPDCIMITSLPNARLAPDVRDLKRLEHTDDHGLAAGFYPDDFLELAKEFPYHISVHVSPLPGEEASFAVILGHRNLDRKIAGALHHVQLPESNSSISTSTSTHTNNPLLVKISGSLIPPLRAHLKERLPEYMVPSHFVLLERFPITSNGKLDRRALPEPALIPIDPTKDFTEPATEIELVLARLWKDVLNLEKVSVNHNFFELGGDSVNAIQVVSRANKEELKISVQMLFQNQTIAGLAAAAEKDSPRTVMNWEASCREFMKSLDMGAILEQLPAGVEIEDIYPASPLQLHQVHMMKDRAGEAPPLFLYQKIELPINITLDVDKLEKVLQIVSGRYRMLRTLLIWKNLPEPVQVVCRKLHFDFVYNDISTVPPEKKNMAVIALLQQDWNKTFVRHNSSPMRIGFIKLDENRYQYYLLGDYMRMEGWSTGEFAREIISFYGMFKAGADMRYPAPQDNCYKEYMHTLRILRKQTENPAAQYWRSLFKDFNGLKPLTSLPGNQIGQGTGFGVAHFYLSAGLSARMEQFVMAHRLSVSPFIQGIWAVLLAHYLREDRIVYGMVTTGRSIPIAGIEHMTGHSINILPMVVPISKEKPLLEYFKDIRDLQTEWTRYEYTPIDQVYEWLDLPGDYPLFDHYVVFQNLGSIDGDIRGLERDKGNAKGNVESVFAKMDYPLRFDIFPGYEYCFILQYYLSSFTTPVVKGLLDNLKTLIETIIENPRQTFETCLKSLTVDNYKSYENECPGGFLQS